MYKKIAYILEIFSISSHIVLHVDAWGLVVSLEKGSLYCIDNKNKCRSEGVKIRYKQLFFIDFLHSENGFYSFFELVIYNMPN